jgi:ubiquitin-protein ligase
MDYPRFNNPRENRLAKEHQLVDDFCKQSNLIGYEGFKRKGGMPPDRYLFHYKLRSIVGINDDQSPIYGDKHIAEIIISPEFPLGGQPACKMKTPVWHPNIKFDGRFAGKICINAESLGSWHTLDMLAERIGEMLQYKNYHAEHTEPYPEDARVAEWVRTYAEPRGIVNKAKKVYTDDRPLLEASEEWLNSRKKKVQITLGVRRKAGMTEEETRQIIEQNQPERKQIVITKRET